MEKIRRVSEISGEGDQKGEWGLKLRISQGGVGYQVEEVRWMSMIIDGGDCKGEWDLRWRRSQW